MRTIVKAEIEQIAGLLNDVYEGVREGSEEAALRLHLTEPAGTADSSSAQVGR